MTFFILMREIKSADLDGGGSREDLENFGEGEIIIGIYFMKKLFSIKKISLYNNDTSTRRVPKSDTF